MVEAKFLSEPSLLELRNNVSSFIDGNIEIQEFGEPTTVLFRIEKFRRRKRTENDCS